MITWREILQAEAEQPYFKRLKERLQKEYDDGATIFPKREHIFRAFQITPFESVKVIILGQDPYQRRGLAEGLAFSVPKLTDVPPSLKNILQEAHDDVGIEIPHNGSLIPWANHGVLLLNTILTVEEDHSLSHAGIGWETFAQAVIKKLCEYHENLVFLLWGKVAQSYVPTIGHSVNTQEILLAPHPSPLSASRGFFGCKHFSKTNEYLKAIGDDPIDWNLI